MMKKILSRSILAALTMPAVASAAVEVSTPDELMDALKGKDKAINITETIVIDDMESVKLIGKGHVLTATHDAETVLHVKNGADLVVKNLNFAGRSFFNPDPDSMIGGSAILLTTDNTDKAAVNVSIANVTVTGFGNHGINISDCEPDSCGDGNDGGGTGTAASMHVVLSNVVVKNSGFGGQDADGIRVNERSAGDLMLTASNVLLQGVGADGIELDEAGDGDVIVKVRNAIFESNGEYCVKQGLNPFEGTKCDDDGDPDVDDAFDIDEAGNGSVIGSIKSIDMVDNYDEGLDFDEEGEGGFDLDIVSVFAVGNSDEAIKISEEDDGDIVANLRALNLAYDREDNDAKKVVEIEEEGAGDVSVTVKGSKILDDELQISQDDEGQGTLKVRGSKIFKLDVKDGVEEI